MIHLKQTNTEYGIYLNEYYKVFFISLKEYKNKRTVYDEFLSETLNPSMFVPAVFEDGKWVILEKKFYPACMSFSEEADIHFKQYKQALENVYFEDCVYENYPHSKISITQIISYNGKAIFSYDCDIKRWICQIGETIEDLIPYKLKLTPTIQNRLK